jgi:hypothetical protein
MNQTFNLSRFAKVFAKQTVDNYRIYLMSIFVLAGLLLLVLSFLTYVQKGTLSAQSQILPFSFLLLLSGSIFSSISFADLGNKKKAIAILTLPASQLEKYLTAWIYSLILFLMVYVLIFYAIVALLSQTNAFGNAIEYLNLFDRNEKVYLIFFVYALLQSVAILGSVYFSNNHFIKTAFTFFIAFFLGSIVNELYLKRLIDESVRSSVLFNSAYLKDVIIRVPEGKEMVTAAVIGVVIVILWACAYYKLKEKEV